jgi:hypothetical protein
MEASVKSLSHITYAQRKVPKRPIVYRWWFKGPSARALLKPFKNEVKIREIEKRNGYWLLYIGRGKNGYERLVKWHILDTSNFHRKKTVKSGRLSSLRQTICGLKKRRMSSSRDWVSAFMRSNCKVEWDELKKGKELFEQEREEIESHYLPLNFQHTTNKLTSAHRGILSKLKRQMKR